VSKKDEVHFTHTEDRMRSTRAWFYLLAAAMMLLVIDVTLSRAQISASLAVESEQSAQYGPICGTTLLTHEYETARAVLEANPGMQEQMRLQKTGAWNFVVGSQKNWFAFEFVEQSHYSVASTCRAVGVNCYIFVENSIWGTRVDQAGVDNIKQGFDSMTPANASKGIYQMDVEAFGAPPDVDNDAKIIILILDIQDGYDGSGGWIAGYFSPLNQIVATNSNQAEIYYVDANPTSLTGNTTTVLSAAAHEFQHLIHYRYDNDEITFVNEACSMVAEVHCGYGVYFASGYVNETNRYLLSWRGNSDANVSRDYSRAARFMTYLRDQFGIGLMKLIVSNTNNGISGLDGAFASHGTPLRFDTVFLNWLVANILDDRTVDPAYGYIYPNLPKAVGRTLPDPNYTSGTLTIDQLAADYISFKLGSDLRITFNLGPNTSPVIKAVKIGPSGKQVVDVAPNAEFHEPGYGTTYTEIHFIVINTSQSLRMAYSYQSSGNAPSAVELKWDGTEPNGFLRLTRYDTLIVTFDPVASGTLSHIRVALRRTGSIQGGVWKLATSGTSPLGQKLAFPITASTDFETPVINAGGTYPYPIPYPNWREVDLKSYNISTDAAFAVGFIVVVPDTPAVMITRYTSTSSYHSFTYLNNPSSEQPGWYYLSADGTSIYLYLIRAYVTFTTAVGEQEVELLPRSIALSQNYPNPFNPGTKIKFTLPQSGSATLKIYNMLGQEVATLVDGELLAGPHEIEWRPSGLPSGVYTYRLQAGQHSESKQLLLLK
jgi:hypothetical protein